MPAGIGDRIIVRFTHGNELNRDGEVLEVHGPQGAPTHVVRWSDNGHEGLYFPGTDTVVDHHEDSGRK
jgi:hypothetical protein